MMDNKKLLQEIEEYDILYPDKVEVEIGSQVISLGPFKIRQMRVVLKALSELFDLFRQNPDMLQNLEANVPFLMDTAFDQMVAICAAAIDKSPEWMEENIAVESFISLLIAVMEVNDIGDIVKNALTVWIRVKRVGASVPIKSAVSSLSET